MKSTAILLAAGFGTRMKSAHPKAMHPLGGRPMLRHLIAAAEACFDRVVVVVGPGMDALAALAAPHPVVVQTDRLGTAHAALQAADLFGDGEVAVLYADNPLIRSETLSRLLDRRRAGDAGLCLLAMRPPEPGQYGRVIERDGATEAEARQRLAAQLPIADKVARADYVIRTDGTYDETSIQVRDVLEQLEADASRRY